MPALKNSNRCACCQETPHANFRFVRDLEGYVCEECSRYVSTAERALRSAGLTISSPTCADELRPLIP